jgi:hypothetical protein
VITTGGFPQADKVMDGNTWERTVPRQFLAYGEIRGPGPSDNALLESDNALVESGNLVFECGNAVRVFMDL